MVPLKSYCTGLLLPRTQECGTRWRLVSDLKKKCKLANPTLGEIKKVMNNVYVHGQREGFLPRTPDGNPISFVRQSLKSDFEPVILTMHQVLDILDNLDLMRRTMALTDAATALGVSEVLALKWNDLDFIAQHIQVRCKRRLTAFCR